MNPHQHEPEFNRAAWALLNETLNTVNGLIGDSACHAYLVQFSAQAEVRNDLVGQLDKMQRKLLDLHDRLYEHGQIMDTLAARHFGSDSDVPKETPQ